MLFDRFYIENYHGGKRFTVGDFLAMGSKITIHQTSVRYEEGLEKKGKSHMFIKAFKRMMSKAGSKNNVPSLPWVKLTELNLEQGL